MKHACTFRNKMRKAILNQKRSLRQFSAKNSFQSTHSQIPQQLTSWNHNFYTSVSMLAECKPSSVLVDIKLHLIQENGTVKSCMQHFTSYQFNHLKYCHIYIYIYMQGCVCTHTTFRELPFTESCHDRYSLTCTVLLWNICLCSHKALQTFLQGAILQ